MRESVLVDIASQMVYFGRICDSLSYSCTHHCLRVVDSFIFASNRTYVFYAGDQQISVKKTDIADMLERCRRTVCPGMLIPPVEVNHPLLLLIYVDPRNSVYMTLDDGTSFLYCPLGTPVRG